MPLNHFELFGLPHRHAIDADALDRAYRELQSQVHPDRFAAASDAERRAAMQRATQANEAYRTLKNPLQRAIYLLSLQGIDVKAESNVAMEPAFLMQQLEWRESVADARAAKNGAALDTLLHDLRAEKRVRYERLAALLDSGAAQPAAEAARQLLFIEKLEQDIGDALESLEAA